MPVEVPAGLVLALRAARAVAVLTGAGVSAESGVPTFRDAQTGLWARFRPTDLATPEAFARDPATVSRWYDERRAAAAAARPNPGHAAIAALERILAARGAAFSLLTQNVDRLHQAAGSRGVVELHGTLWVWRCVRCRAEREERGGPFPEHPPRCPCGGVRRPGVVWFGERLPDGAVAAAGEAIERCDLFLSAGTSAVVEPAASFAAAAKGNGARTAEVNLEPTPISDLVEWSVRGRSGEVLPALVAEAFPDAPAGP